VFGDGRQTRCFADVRDIVRGIVALAECPLASGQVFNLGSTREISIADLAHLIIDITASESKLVYIPYDQAYESGFEDMSRRVPDISKVQALIGWQAETPLEDSIRAIAEQPRTKK
jgi:UDP-glucose 4-epimerase